MILVTYTCFAVPPYGICLKKQYEYGEDEIGSYYRDSKSKTYIDSDIAKMFFTPVDSTWKKALAKLKDE